MISLEYLNKLYGKFWSSVWKEPEFISALKAANQLVFGDLEIKREQLSLYLSRFTVPELERLQLYKLTLTTDNVTQDLYHLGDFTLDSGYTLDLVRQNPEIYIFDCPFEDVGSITDSPINGRTLYTKGVDFRVQDNKIYLYHNPFAGQFRGILRSDGTVTADLWLTDCLQDVQALTNHFGVYLGMHLQPTAYHKRIMNAVWDLYVEGATRLNIRRFFGALTDTGVCEAAGTVEDSWTEGGRSYVKLDTGIYSCPSPAVSIVSVGQALEQGDLLFDSFKILRANATISASDIPSLTLGKGMVDTEAGLTFYNQEYTSDSMYFPLGGSDDDVTAFWVRVINNCTAAGIDLPTSLYGHRQPPYTINPFDFLRSNFLASNTFFVTLQLETLQQYSDLRFASYLLDTLPASSTYFLHVNAVTQEETDGITQTADDTATFQCGDAEELDSPVITEYVRSQQRTW